MLISDSSQMAAELRIELVRSANSGRPVHAFIAAMTTLQPTITTWPLSNGPVTMHNRNFACSSAFSSDTFRQVQ